MTIDRVSHFQSPYVITDKRLKDLSAKLLKDLSIPQTHLLLEPLAKNTAAAVALAVHYFNQIEKMPSDTVIGIFPADHTIKETHAFSQAINAAEQQAKLGAIVTLGIKPTQPATGYGYIEIESSEFVKLGSHYPVKRFIEKPSLERAKEFIQSNQFYWNAGIFIFRIDSMLNALQMHTPTLHDLILKVRDLQTDLANIYPQLPSISIDTAVMEKLSPTQLNCIPVDLGWSDLGTWDSICENGLQETHVTICNEKSEHNFVHGIENKTYAFNHISDLIVVDTPDALLVSRKGDSESIKNLVQSLEKLNPKIVQEHNFENRPWGKYEILKDEQQFKSKIIEIDPSQQLSYQSHNLREEHWIVVEGQGEFTLNDQVRKVKKGDYLHVPIQAKHRLKNTGSSPLRFIEVQLGTSFDESDIIRYQDDYDRN